MTTENVEERLAVVEKRLAQIEGRLDVRFVWPESSRTMSPEPGPLPARARQIQPPPVPPQPSRQERADVTPSAAVRSAVPGQSAPARAASARNQAVVAGSSSFATSILGWGGAA
ncbi:MAG TPA: hypothetical protein VN682_13190, partial [Terriglobales bacterium]|nr:hypothetical protein [Terriglobales bacterium]